MDTGYVHLLDDAQRQEVLGRTRAVLGGRPFVAGAFVGDRPGDPFDRDAYLSTDRSPCPVTAASPSSSSRTA